jgi:hypothetical protein
MKLMTSIYFTLALMFAFVAAPTNSAFACGGGSESCCKKEVKKDSDTKSCCNKKGKNKKGCDGNCGKKGCHCPQQTCSNASIIPQIIEINFPKHNFSLKSQTNWYYLEKIPNSVYLSLRLPPKISC